MGWGSAYSRRHTMTKSNTDRMIEELYRSYSGDVFRFVLYLSGDWALAQDVTSDTFVRAWTAAVPVEIRTAKSYLFVIARNLYLDAMRRRRPEDVEVRERADLSRIDQDYAAREELEQTIADLAQIAEGDRAALVMAVFEEMSQQEVAAALGVSVGSVKSRIFRARMKLVELREERLNRRLV